MRHVGNDRWEGSFAVGRAGPLGVHGHGLGRPLRLLARRAARARSRSARRTSASELVRGRGRSSAASSLTVEEGAGEAPASERSELDELGAATTLDVDRVPRPLRLLVRALPALVGRLRGRRARAAAARRARLRRRLPAADPPDRRDEPQGPQQRARRRSRRSRQPVGDRRRRRAGTTRSTPSSARSRTSTASCDAGRRLGHRDRARLRDPVLARPPVAARAPRVVPPPPRRDAQVRREPAQALPGHLQPQLRLRRLARALGGAARRRALLGRPRRADLPRRQPAHEAGRRSGSG